MHNREKVLRLPRPSTTPGRLPQLRLDATTPPGTYRATLESGERSEAVTIEVTPAPRLGAAPGVVRLAGAPGGTAEARIALTNRGNTSVAIPARAHVGLYDDDGIELAFADTYRQPQGDLEKVAGHWLRKLREGHGGLLPWISPTGRAALNRARRES